LTSRLIVQPEAQGDLDDAYRWYEACQNGLGRAFIDEAGAKFDLISSKPELFTAGRSGVRRVLLSRFPYVVLYVARAKQVFVLAVLHQSRHPRVGQRRASSFAKGKQP
jgi:plasmid stabilization system protein ParE